jgi:TldD protein
MSRGVDYADLYFELSREESWSLEDGIVKDGSHSIEQGVGVRAISGEKTGFAYTDEVLLPALVEASDAARAIASSGGAARSRPGSRRSRIGCTCRSIRSRPCATRTRSNG